MTHPPTVDGLFQIAVTVDWIHLLSFEGIQQLWESIKYHQANPQYFNPCQNVIVEIVLGVQKLIDYLNIDKLLQMVMATGKEDSFERPSLEELAIGRPPTKHYDQTLQFDTSFRQLSHVPPSTINLVEVEDEDGEEPTPEGDGKAKKGEPCKQDKPNRGCAEGLQCGKVEAQPAQGGKPYIAGSELCYDAAGCRFPGVTCGAFKVAASIVSALTVAFFM